MNFLQQQFQDVKCVINQSSVNALLLGKVLDGEHVDSDITEAVIDGLLSRAQERRLDKEMLSDVFEKHNISHLTDSVYTEIEKDPINCPYGSISMF